MRIFFAILSGGLFGAGLLLSGMTNTNKVQGFLDLFGNWDPTLAFVMGGAMIPMAIAWQMTKSRAPVIGGSFPEMPATEFDRRLITGSVLFGLGWGLAGLCPGPAIASLTYGGTGGFLFLAAMLIGMRLAPTASRYLDSRSAAA